MQTVLLAGGLGTRLREETEFKPKPMVEIGGRPVLWHLMSLFSHYGFSDFVVCTGYRADVIRDYFVNFEARNRDFVARLGETRDIEYFGDLAEENWRVTVADTGVETMTGGRVNRVKKYLDGPFIVTYGDGLADVNIDDLVKFHQSHGKLATVTTIRPLSRFGIMEIGEDGQVHRFKEKPLSEDYVNAGFFVFEPKVFDYLDDECVLEREPLENLARDGQLMAFQHNGFFQPMDTYREFVMLNDMWTAGEAAWKVW